MKKLVTIIAILSVHFLMGQEFPIVTGSYSQTYPSAAFANGKYYNAFLDKSSGSYNYGFHGKFIEPDGNVLQQEIEIISPIGYLSFMHEIVYGQDNYLFAWSRGVTIYDRDAYGQIIDNEGNPTGGFFPVSIGNQESASFVEVAFDGENYLVVWQEGLPNNGSVIRGQFVDQAGQLVGNNFSIRPDGIVAAVDQIYPDVEFDGEKYLVVWDDNRMGNRDIYGLFVSTEGAFTGDEVVITSHNTDQLLVQLAFGGNKFYAVWADERLSSNDKSIFGQLINMDGSLNGDNLVISPQVNSEGRSWPDVAASNGEFLVVWDQEWLEYDKPTIQNPDRQKYEAAGVDFPRPTVWYDIYARKISLQGEYLSDEMAICTADYHQQDCDVASDGADFLVSWSDSRNNNMYSDVYGFIVEGSELPLPPVVNPGEIDFVKMDQFLEGGESFSVYNPNDFPIEIDSITFATENTRVWYLNETVSYPYTINPDSTIQLSFNLLFPAGEVHTRGFETDTLIIQSFGDNHKILLNIEEALLDTLHVSKMEFLQDSIYFVNVFQAYNGLSVEMVNRHFPGIKISSVDVSGPYALWDIVPEEELPYTIAFRDTFQFTVFSVLPVQPEFVPDEIGIDTLWFNSWEPEEYQFPIYYETAVIDTIWTRTDEVPESVNMKVYPNPAADYIILPSPENVLCSGYEIFDVQGNLMKKSSKVGRRGIEIVDVSQLNNGIYFVRLVLDDETYMLKFIIHR